ncbi:uncharacterized protein (TIGR01777 family) [Virgibacillus natechei]|uniref:Uncharacterized protein (TIGR01777 family) n=1 Tax=Virgibacillus natechei TaxID=1216297 RepID=A0ABS4II51_9BACI|nr:TIGR01777 family oxidoreductase [Virgibacillus natechei]MBP1970590.1 uncharacterized protein (TIGR01777 family) [Virgibacillus natechei]UZD14013.1 TIGR01777 family oxidoreductase [Virgibacillus natechei]
MNILVTGGTGFVGRNLTAALHEKDHHCYVLTRFPENYSISDRTTFISYDYPVEKLPLIHGVINLAGESLFGYWTDKKKESIINSRLKITQKVIDIISKLDKKPEVFISGSAVGFYGMSDEQIFTEATTQPGDDFLAEVATEWEQAAQQVEEMGIRTVYARFGVILGEKGALQYMSLPVKMFVGGKIGDGEQWITWVHIEDVVGILQFCLFNNIEGPVNVTAPNPRRNKDFTKLLSDVLKRPYWFPTPSPFIRLTLGEMSQLITKGQYVLPKKAQNKGYQFSYPYLRDALRDIKT